MNRRYVLAAAVALAVVSGSAAPTLADDKQLQNVKGSVSYQAPNKAAIAIGTNATVGLADQYYAITGGSSLAAVSLPDSSRVMVGADTKVQLAFFNQTQIATAKFVIYDGKVRFAVHHPQGAKANYTFTTATGTIGVRGTQGDIELDNNGALRVNVYEVCDPNNPVRVTMKGGKSFTVLAGQSILAQVVNGVVKAQVQQLTQQLIDQFAPDFGVPANWDQAKGQVVAYAQNKAAGAVNGVTGGYGGDVVSSVGALFKHRATPSPSPVPTQSSCN